MRPLTDATAQLLRPCTALNDTDAIRVEYVEENERYTLIPYATYTIGGKSCRSYASQPLIQSFDRFPERKCLSDKTWAFSVGATDISVALMLGMWGIHRLAFADQATLDKFNHTILLTEVSERNAARVANWRLTNKLPSEVESLELTANVSLQLRPFQKIAAYNTLVSEGYGLLMEMGTGKTPVTIATICNLINRLKSPRKIKALVVTQKNIRLNWADEVARFTTRETLCTVLRGSELDRLKQFFDAMSTQDHEVSIVVCSYGLMARGLQMLTTTLWDLVALDESHNIKDPKTKQSKAAMVLRDSSLKRVCLTGSAMGNSIMDFYAQLEFMGRGLSGFIDYSAYRKFYGKFERGQGGQGGHETLVAVQNMPFLKERLARHTFIVTKEEALPHLPPKVYDVVECEMSPEQRDIYEQVRDQLAVEIENDLNSSENLQLTVNNVLTKMLRLAQITAGHVKWDAVQDPETGAIIRPAIIQRFENAGKLNEICEGIHEFLRVEPRDKFIVWCAWREDVDMIAERLRAEHVELVTYYGLTPEKEREIAKQRFNGDRGCRGFVGTAASGGVGLNLIGYPPGAGDEYDTNCSEQCIYSQNWSSIVRDQSESRAHRSGTRKPVRIRDFVVPGTIDEEIRAVVTKKRIDALEVKDVRAILRRVLEGKPE